MLQNIVIHWAIFNSIHVSVCKRPNTGAQHILSYIPTLLQICLSVKKNYMTKIYLGVIFVIHILVHANNNLRAKFEMPSITCCKYRMAQNKNVSRLWPHLVWGQIYSLVVPWSVYELYLVSTDSPVPKAEKTPKSAKNSGQGVTQVHRHSWVSE